MPKGFDDIVEAFFIGSTGPRSSKSTFRPQILTSKRYNYRPSK
ncbi:hypothetical protein ALT1545_90126 [Alteromonas macleodii]